MKFLHGLPSLVLLLTLAFVGSGHPLVAQNLTTDPAAGRLLLEAERLQKAGDTEAALQELTLLVERFPQAAQAPEALLEIARGRARQNQIADSRLAAQQLTERYPSSPFAAGGFVLLAELLARNQPSPQTLEEARTILNRVPLLFGRSRYPELPARHQAFVLGGELSWRLGDPQQAAASFVAAIEDEPPSPETSRARIGLASILLAEGDWVAAADVLQRAVQNGEQPGHPEANAAAAAQARRSLTLIHRLLVRPAAGQPSWLSARVVPTPGLELRKPVAVAAAEDGSVMIVDRSLDAVVELVAGGALGQRRQVSKPGKPWFGADGVAYFADDGAVRQLVDSGSRTFSAPKGNRTEDLKQIAAGERGTFGQWYLLDESGGRVVVFVPQGRYLNTLAEGDPQDLAQDPLGDLLVLDRKARRVSRYSSSGTAKGVAASGDWRKPEALAVDGLGRIYVLDRDTARIDIFSASGSKVATVGPTLPGGIELKAPTDLAVDGNGRIFIADSRLQAVVVLE